MYTEKELQLLDLIRTNPYASQVELAEKLHLSRPSIANLISGLTKSGAIKGRAYVLAETNSILVFGGMNIDRKMIVKDQLVFHTSNPVTSYQTAGGVARNIAENLGRLGHEVKLLSAAGKDLEFEFLREKTTQWADMHYCLQSENERTGTYTAILDQQGEMQLALADMEIYKSITPEWILQNENLFPNASLIVIDLNIEKDSITTLLHLAKRYKVPVAIVPVSGPKMKNLPEDLSGVEWLICNHGEAELVTSLQINDQKSLKNAHQVFQERGIRKTVITNGENGISYSENDKVEKMSAMKPKQVVDVTGAGDSFVAATLHCWLKTGTIEPALKAGLLNATKTLESNYTVRPELTEEGLIKEMEELK